LKKKGRGKGEKGGAKRKKRDVGISEEKDEKKPYRGGERNCGGGPNEKKTRGEGRLRKKRGENSSKKTAGGFSVGQKGQKERNHLSRKEKRGEFERGARTLGGHKESILGKKKKKSKYFPKGRKKKKKQTGELQRASDVKGEKGRKKMSRGERVTL